MESRPLTFDQVPDFLYQLGRKVDDLAALLKEQSAQNSPQPDRWFDIEELSEYLPGKPAITTLYGKVQRREIPFSREGKRLVFQKSLIDKYLQGKHVKTNAELLVQADQYVNSRKGGRKAE